MQQPSSHHGRLRTVDLAGLAACLLLTAGAYVVGFEPIVAERAEAAERRRELMELSRDADDAADALGRMRQDFRVTQERVEANAIRLKPIDYLNHRLSEITELATRAGLEIDEIKPGEGLPSEHFVRVPIHLTGRGVYVDSASFLHKLHVELPDMAVEGLIVTARPQANNSAPTFDYELLWYAAPKPGAPAR